MQKIDLKIVKNEDIKFLYNLLKKRGINENISHNKLPTFKQHERFVNSKPYSKWYVIICNEKRVGSVYLTKQNEIGIHLIWEKIKIQIIKNAIAELIRRNKRKRYFFNVNPKNRTLIKFYRSQKFRLIQNTYELKNETD